VQRFDSQFHLIDIQPIITFNTIINIFFNKKIISQNNKIALKKP